jgi:hypothetical protein
MEKVEGCIANSNNYKIKSGVSLDKLIHTARYSEILKDEKEFDWYVDGNKIFNFIKLAFNDYARYMVDGVTIAVSHYFYHSKTKGKTLIRKGIELLYNSFVKIDPEITDFHDLEKNPPYKVKKKILEEYFSYRDINLYDIINIVRLGTILNQKDEIYIKKYAMNDLKLYFDIR